MYISPKKKNSLIFQPAMLVVGMKKNTVFSPSNLPGKLNFHLEATFRTNSTSALAMPSAKFPEALSGWYLTSFQRSRGGCNLGGGVKICWIWPQIPILDAYWKKKNTTPFSGDVFFMKFKEKQRISLFFDWVLLGGFMLQEVFLKEDGQV